MSQNPSKQEQDDLIQLQADRLKEKDNFSSLVLHYLRMEESMLKHCGSKTKEEAIFKSAQAHEKSLNKLVQAHIKKYPD